MTIDLNTFRLLARLSNAPAIYQPQVAAMRLAANTLLRADGDRGQAQIQAGERETAFLHLGDDLETAIKSLAVAMACDGLHPNNGLGRFSAELDDYHNFEAREVMYCIRLAERLVVRIEQTPWLWPDAGWKAFELPLAAVRGATERLKEAAGPMKQAWADEAAAHEKFFETEQDWEIGYYRLRRQLREAGLLERFFGPEGEGEGEGEGGGVEEKKAA